MDDRENEKQELNTGSDPSKKDSSTIVPIGKTGVTPKEGAKVEEDYPDDYLYSDEDSDEVDYPDDYLYSDEDSDDYLYSDEDPDEVDYPDDYLYSDQDPDDYLYLAGGKIVNNAKKSLEKIDELSIEEIDRLLNGFGEPNEEGIVTFNDPIAGAKLAAKFKELTGKEHETFNECVVDIIRQIQDDKEALMEYDGKTFNAQYFQNIKAISYAADGREGYELVSTFPGEQKGWNPNSPQLMSLETLETMLSIAGKRLIVADQDKMYFNADYDIVTLARANEVYKSMTGHSHPRYEEILPELVKREREVLLDKDRSLKLPLSRLKRGRAVVDAYDFEEVDLSKELFSQEERDGLKLIDERKGKLMPEDRKEAEQLLISPKEASFEEISFMLDHIGPNKYKVGQDEIEGLIDIDTIERLNDAFKQFSGGKSHPRYLAVMPTLIKQEKELKETTEERKDALDKLAVSITTEKNGGKAILVTGERFKYESHEKSDFDRMMLDLDNTPSEVIAKNLYDFVMKADEKEITVEDLATITKLREILKNRKEKENPEVELFLTRVANAKNNSQKLEDKVVEQKEENEKHEGPTITGGGAAVFVTAEMFGKIGRGVVSLVGKAMRKIKEMRQKSIEKKQEKEAVTKGDTAKKRSTDDQKNTSPKPKTLTKDSNDGAR